MGITTNIQEKKEILKYRYVCYGCTDIAFKSFNNIIGNMIVCDRCGKEQITVLENYIAL